MNGNLHLAIDTLLASVGKGIELTDAVDPKKDPDWKHVKRKFREVEAILRATKQAMPR